MTKIPASVLSVTSMLLHVIIVPVFFLCFILLYESAWMMRFLDERNGDQHADPIGHHGGYIGTLAHRDDDAGTRR